MARLPRYILPGQPQHVVHRGHSRKAIFAATSDYHEFSELLAEACQRHECALHAYVLMTNHVHLLMTPNSETGIGNVLQSIGRKYTRAFNRRNTRTGPLWESRYRATPIDTERYLLTCYRYIELNPVRARIVAHPMEYRWSSYAANALGRADPLVTAHDTYHTLGLDDGSRRAAYTELFAIALDEATLTTIREATHKGWALGDESFRERVARVSRRRAAPARRGGAYASV